ncbi:MAG: hypothetical protein ACXADX_14890 [Candidatus Hodarchaeales archaeon]|jgi:hypothetical protein
MKETQKEDLQLYKVAEDYSGELQEVKKPPDSLKSTNVYILVNDLLLKIYVWIGAQTHVRARFIGAQSAQSLQRARGATYHVITVEGGDEIEEFRQMLALVGSSVQFDLQTTEKEKPQPQETEMVFRAPPRKTPQEIPWVDSRSSPPPSQENQLDFLIQMKEDIHAIREDIQMIKEDLQTIKGKSRTKRKKK